MPFFDLVKMCQFESYRRSKVAHDSGRAWNGGCRRRTRNKCRCNNRLIVLINFQVIMIDVKSYFVHEINRRFINGDVSPRYCYKVERCGLKVSSGRIWNARINSEPLARIWVTAYLSPALFMSVDLRDKMVLHLHKIKKNPTQCGQRMTFLLTYSISN